MDAPQPCTADAADRERLIDIIVLGFAADPIARWVWKEAPDYLALMPDFANAFGGRAFELGTAYHDGRFQAAAFWLPPGVEPDETGMNAVVEKTLASRPEFSEDLAGLFEGMAAYHPAEPHWYLPMIAADPRATGQGLGAALMKHALARCDEDGLPAYLESSNPRNISLYERHGFEAIGEIRSGSSPVMTPMYRKAR